MGCDGGTIPRRDELVRTKKKPEKKDKESAKRYKWRHCAVSQEVLRKPIVACQLGRFYNKEALIEALLNKNNASVISHIKSLKDIKEVKFTPNPAFASSSDVADNRDDPQSSTAAFICPVTSLEMNGVAKFCLIWNCGCALSERALKEVSGSNCHVCGAEFAQEDVVVLNPEEGTDDEAQNESRMEARKAKAKAAKKEKKAAKANGIAEQKEEKPAENGQGSSKREKDSKLKRKRADPAGPSNSTVINDPLAVVKKLKKGKSIADDPTATEAYKSLFTSHKDAKSKATAHWVTFNPFFN